MNVTLLDNVYGDNIRHAKMEWKDITNMIKHPPYRRKKGIGGIIGGACIWKDCHAVNTKTGKEMVDTKGNFIIRAEKGTRKCINRQLIVLDCDDIDNYDTFLERVTNFFEFFGAHWAIYSSFSAKEDNPRFRIVTSLEQEVTPDEYQLIARTIMRDIGIQYFDPVSDRPNQVMFLPAWPEYYDQELEMWESGYYDYEIGDGEPMDNKMILSYTEVTYDNHKDYKPVKRDSDGNIIDVETKPVCFKASGPRPALDLYEDEDDPRNKDSIIGEFCRTYSISEAIEEFDLPYDYVSCDLYKYRDSTSNAAGAHIKNDDTLFYSFHQSDPACGKDLNAFDLVLIHVYDGDYVSMCREMRKKLNYYTGRTA